MADSKISGLTPVTDFQAADEFVLARSGATNSVTAANIAAGIPRGLAFLPTGALASSVDVRYCNSSQGLASGQLYLVAIELLKGQTITSISYYSNGTALATGTHQIFGLYDTNTGTTGRALLRSTVDDTNTAWAANSLKTLALTSPYVTTRAGLFYCGITVAAGTMPGVLAATISPGTASVWTPILGAVTGDSGLTALPNPTSTLTRQSQSQLAIVS